MTEQGTLFNLTPLYDRPFVKAAQVRNAIGECIQNFVVEFFKFREIRIDGREPICPDFSFGDTKGEIKSVGKNKRCLVYKWRLAKEMTHFGDKPYFYIFAQHRIEIKIDSGSAIIASLLNTPPDIYICSLAEVNSMLSDRPIRKFSLFEGGKDNRIGYNRAGYIEGGWQFSLSMFNFSGCILAESTYCNESAFVKVYYTKGSANFITTLQPVAKNTLP